MEEKYITIQTEFGEKTFQTKGNQLSSVQPLQQDQVIRFVLSEDPANYTEGLVFEDEGKALAAYANHQEYGKESYLFEFHHPDDSKAPPTAIFAWKSIMEKVRIL